MCEFVFGQADCGLIDFVTNVALVLSDIRTVLRMRLHVVLQLCSRFAVFVAISAMQAHLLRAIENGRLKSMFFFFFFKL